MSRAVLQALNAAEVDETPDMSPEAQAGMILAFCIVAFVLVLLGAYSVFLTSKIKLLNADLLRLGKRVKEMEMEKDDDDIE